MNEFQTGAVRDTGGKGRMDLLPWSALMRISKHMEDAIRPDPETGMPHYPERNWEKGIPMHSMIDSALRHLAKYVDGQTDEDHLCAAATNLLMAMWTEEKLPDMVDIPAVKASRIYTTQGGDRRSASESTGNPGSRPHREKPDPDRCLCYRPEEYSIGHVARCSGTKENEPCKCGGDCTKCDFYPEIREEAAKKSSHKTIYAHIK